MVRRRPVAAERRARAALPAYRSGLARRRGAGGEARRLARRHATFSTRVSARGRRRPGYADTSLRTAQCWYAVAAIARATPRLRRVGWLAVFQRGGCHLACGRRRYAASAAGHADESAGYAVYAAITRSSGSAAALSGRPALRRDLSGHRVLASIQALWAALQPRCAGEATIIRRLFPCQDRLVLSAASDIALASAPSNSDGRHCRASPCGRRWSNSRPEVLTLTERVEGLALADHVARTGLLSTRQIATLRAFPICSTAKRCRDANEAVRR